MTELKLCGIVICGVIICYIFKGIKAEYSMYIRIVIAAMITAISLSILMPILSYIEKITKNTIVYGYLPILIKILGIAIVTEITADTCMDMGENGIANKIAVFAKAEILVLTMPIIEALLNMCLELI